MGITEDMQQGIIFLQAEVKAMREEFNKKLNYFTEILKIDPDKAYDNREAAKYLGLSSGTLRGDRVRGHMKIPYEKIGKKIVYRHHVLVEYRKKRKRNHTADPGPEGDD